MKKLQLLALSLSVFSLGFLSSCSEETTDPLGPTIDWVNSTNLEQTITEGESVTFEFYVKEGDSKIERVEAYLKTAGVNAHFYDSNDSSSVPSDGEKMTLTKAFADKTGSPFTVYFTVTDKDGLSITDEVKVIVNAAATPLTDQGSQELGSHDNATLGSYYSVTEDETYTQSVAGADATSQSKVDIIFYYGATNEATLAAPNDETVGSTGVNLTTGWTTKNATKFSTTTVDFATATDATIEGLSATASKVTNLEVNDVVYFETVAEEKGLIKITAITVGADGSATISVKVK